MLNAKRNNNQTLDVVATCLDVLTHKFLVFESAHKLQQQKQRKQDKHVKTTSEFENSQSMIQMRRQELQKKYVSLKKKCMHVVKMVHHH